ncbi:MAG: LysR family transcriptional regulator [Candidatus Sumerlaeia bacterium]|nr:LysR family transcriptional regulator [Candidatus Sumerlaeia bacterium]
MNDRQLEALIYLSRCGTFKEAARSLYHDSDENEYVTPEALQYRIRALEEELGISLYKKRQGTSRVTLTREGHLFLNEAITIHQRMQRWRSMFAESTRGKLSFAATELVIMHRLPEPVRLFHERLPQIELVVKAASPENIEAKVRSGEVDFGLATHPPEGDDLEYVVWKRSGFVVITPRGHELTRMEKPALQDLVHFPLIVLLPDPSRSDDRARVDAAFRRAEVNHTPNIVLETSNSELIKTFVEAGIGVGIVAETSVLTLRHEIDVVRMGDEFGQTEVGLLVREEKLITRAMREFLLLLSDTFEPWLEKRENGHRR